MKIIDFLREESCIASLSSTVKEDVLKELCDLLDKNGDVDDGKAIFNAVMMREQLGSTGIGEQVAIPHAKSAGVQNLVAAFGLSKEGVEYVSVDDRPVRIIFLLVASDNATGTHLKALARISRLLKKPDFRQKIANGTSAKEIYNIIGKEDEALG